MKMDKTWEAVKQLLNLKTNTIFFKKYLLEEGYFFKYIITKIGEINIPPTIHCETFTIEETFLKPKR